MGLSEAVTSVLGVRPVASTVGLLSKSKCRVFAFHGVSDADAFDRVLRDITLRFDVVRVDQMFEPRPGHRPPAVVTFDDGYASTVSAGLPVLRRHNVSATMFVCPGIATGSQSFWWDVVESAATNPKAVDLWRDKPSETSPVTFLKSVPDERRRDVVARCGGFIGDEAPRLAADPALLQTWLDAGMALGNHTWDHPMLDRCDALAQERQIVDAHEWLHNFTGSAPKIFAYPNGEWSTEAETVLRSQGYSNAFLFDHRLAEPSDEELRISRLRIDSDVSPSRQRAIVSGGHSMLFSAARGQVRRGRQNLSIFESGRVLDSYDPNGGLTPAERVLVDNHVPAGASVLDLGVGTGRTTPALVAKAGRYVGVDYSPRMIERARQLYPDVEFAVADAADLGRYEDGSFDVVLLSYNGFDYLASSAEREAALNEMKRVVRVGGVVIYSSHNARAIFRRPKHVPGRAPTTGWFRAAVATALAVSSRLRTMSFWRGEGYSTDHVQGLETFFTRRSALEAELVRAGLDPVEFLASDHPKQLNRFVSPWIYVAARKSADAPIAVDRFAGLEVLEEFLATNAAVNASISPFQTAAWIQAWKKSYAPKSAITSLVARSVESETLGVLPLAKLSRRLHTRIPLPVPYWGIAGSGHGGADHVGPVATDAMVTTALIRAAIGHARVFRPVLLEGLAADVADAAVRLPNARLVRRTTCMVATRAPDGLFSDAWTPKMAKNVRRRDRQLAEQGIVARWVPPGDEFDAALQSLQGLHQARWQAEAGDGQFAPERVAMFSNFAGRTRQPNQPWVLLLERAGVPVGGLLGLVQGQSFSVYKTGWDPSMGKLGIGIALGTEAMRQAERWGVTTFDYLRGQRAHKVDLGCVAIDDSSVVIGSGPLAWLLEQRERRSFGGIRRTHRTKAWTNLPRGTVRRQVQKRLGGPVGTFRFHGYERPGNAITVRPGPAEIQWLQRGDSVENFAHLFPPGVDLSARLGFGDACALAVLDSRTVAVGWLATRTGVDDWAGAWVSSGTSVGYINQIFVDPHERGKGIGIQVVSALLAESISRSTTAIRAIIDPDNLSSRRTFEALGFARKKSILGARIGRRSFRLTTVRSFGPSTGFRAGRKIK